MITSLQSPHVEAVKALLGSRGVKERHDRGQYVIESVQNIKAALASQETEIESIFYTQEGLERLGSFYHSNLIEVSPQVMKAMTDTVSPQGVLAIAKLKRRALSELKGLKSGKFLYFWQIQDPGNAGTIIRTADAFGFDAVIFSDSSVDLYSPKVIRSTAGSFWQTKVLDEVSVEEIKEFAEQTTSALFATKSDGALLLRDAARESVSKPSIWIFGNEARGLPPEVEASLGAKPVSIPMAGKTESLNLATAASVVMYAVANADK
jgi:TrmH family RNA methyltransferase